MTKQNAFTQFVNDDDGYLRWLAQNPDGFVVNSNRVPVNSYLILHRASYKWINTPDRTNWTTTGYIKTCSNDLTVLSEWAEQEVGGSLKPCKTCQPDSESSSSPTSRQVDPISEPRTDVPITPAPSPAEASLSPGKRSLPPTISTGCLELDLAWQTYASMILNRSQILIPDTDDDLTWHAFLGHSIDMQGFRAAEFAGVDLLTRNAPKFMPLKTRGIGVPELAGLWEVPEIRQHLLWQNKDVSFAVTLGVLRTHGGKIGASLTDAFDHFPWRKFHWSVRALLQNSAVLQPFEFSFRRWLQYECERLGVQKFPPTNFRRVVTFQGTRVALERALRKRLEQTYYMVGPAMSAYMLCDWQLWLWREGLTAVFANFKLDTFHEAFVKKFGRGVIPADEAGFVHWWHGLLPELPPRLANECIWLAVEKKLVDPWTGPMREPMATEGGTPGSTRITYPYESGFIQALREGVRLGRKTLHDGDRIEVKLKEGGYEGGYSVVINPDDQKEFVVIGSVEDPEHFPRRIRVAAWALKLEEEFGRFLIKHFHDTGIVTIEREDDGNQGTTTSTGGEQGRETSGDVLVIVPCGYTKVWDSDPHRGSVQAKDAYTSLFFTTNRAYAEKFGSRWVILSAKYGFIRPDFQIPGPYNVSFKDPATKPVEAPTLIDQIKELGLGKAQRVIGLGGKEYRAMIKEAFAPFGCPLSFPFAGLPIEEMIQATKGAIESGKFSG